MDRAAAGEPEAVARLEMVLAVSRALATAVDTFDHALHVLVDTTVPAFADLCAVEMVDAEGVLRTAAYRVDATSGLRTGAEWEPRGHSLESVQDLSLSWHGADSPEAVTRLREELDADSAIVVPIVTGGVGIGWLIFATASGRRGLRPSAARVADELSSRIATTVQRVSLHRSVVVSAAAQARTARQLRRLAAASANLAGATDRESVLQTACVEVCVVLDAAAAVACWRHADGTEVCGSAGRIDDDALAALEAALTGAVEPAGRWHAQVIPCPTPGDRAAMVVEASLGEEGAAMLGSLASIVPVAFERAATTDAAAAHERRLQAVLDASPVALVTTDTAGVVQGTNPAASALFGWSTAEPARWPEPLGATIAELVVATLAGATVSGSAVRANDLDLIVSVAPFPGTAGEAAIVAAVDVRVQRNAERALIEAQRLEAIGQVAGGVAHDFNNRLTVITGYASMLALTLKGDQEKSMIAAIERAADDAAQLTRRLLGLARPGSAAASAVDLVEVARGLQEVLARIVGSGIALRVVTPATPVVVDADPNEMEQVVLNLAINASDAMEGRGRLDITVRPVVLDAVAARRRGVGPGHYGELEVRDDGPGMSAEVLQRCLEPFFTTKDRGRGSGLGLSTIQASVTQHGGRLDVESAPGRGATFRVLLPATAGAVRSAEVGDHVAAPTLPAGTVVLLVEDEDELRDLAERTLRSAGAEVLAVSDGDEAVAAHRAGGFTAVVTDVVMPGMSGADAAELMHRREPHLPVLFTTGYADRDSGRLRGLPPGQVLAKPYRPAELVARLAALLEPVRAGSGTRPPAR